MMIALSLFYVFVLAITFRTIRKQRPAQKFSNEIFRVREIGMTSVLGALLWLEAGAILAYGITLPERLSGGFSSDLNVFGFLVLSILLGAYMQLYYFVKAIVVTDAGIVGISVWGKQTVLEWQDISEIRVSMLRRVTLGGAQWFCYGRRREKGLCAFFASGCEKNTGRYGQRYFDWLE